MRKPTSLKVINKAESLEAHKKIKEKFSNTQTVVTPCIARKILPVNVQNHLNTLTCTMKAILDKALASHPDTYNDGTYAIFFVPPNDISEILVTLTNLMMVKYSTPLEATAYKNALYWPGCGVVVTEYYFTETGTTISTLEHPECFESPLSEEVIFHFAYQVRQNLDNWRNAQQKNENDGVIARFTSAIMYIEEHMHAVATSIDEWINDEKEVRIEHEIYEDFLTLNQEEEVDMSVFEAKKL